MSEELPKENGLGAKPSPIRNDGNGNDAATVNPAVVNQQSRQWIPRGIRPTKKEAWIWQDRVTIWHIVDKLGTRAPRAIAIYVILTQIAGENKGVSTFPAAINRIAHMAGMSYRTAIDVLHELADEAKVITIQSVKAKNGVNNDKSIYTLLQKPHTGGVQDSQSGVCKREHASFAESKTDNTTVGGILKKENAANGLPCAGAQQPSGVSELDAIRKPWLR